MRVASIDIGSHTVLGLIVERDAGGRWQRLADIPTLCRLAEGLDATQRISELAVQRVEAALDHLVQTIDAMGVQRVFATGTAPFRRAANGSEIARRLGKRLGVPVDVISGEEEARLSLLSTRAAFPEFQRLRICDIGGASTELIRVEDRYRWQATSLDIGAVRLAERFDVTRPMTLETQEAVREEIRAELARPEVQPIFAEPDLPLVGVAGTVTTVATALLELDTWDADRVHGLRISLTDMEHLVRALPSLSVTQRAALRGIPSGRADIIAVGAMLLHEIMLAAQCSELVVSERGVRWGRLETIG